MTMASEGYESEDVGTEAAFEAFDEGDYEAYDESDGEDVGAEADYESADESEPEAMFESSDETADEGAESLDESSDESADEAVAASAATRRWVGQVAAAQRRELQQATASQQQIARQLRAIPSVRGVRNHSMVRLQGGTVFTAELANGRRAKLALNPSPALVSQVNRLGATINANDRRQSGAIAAIGRGFASFKNTTGEWMKKETAARVQSDKEVRKQMSDGLTALDKRLNTELGTRNGTLAKHSKRMIAMVKRANRRSMARSAAAAVALPIFAAYGDRSSPISPTNLKLTGSLAFWMFGGDVLGALAGGSKAGGSLRRLGDVWSYAGFAGNAVTSHLLVKDQQHERFVTGTATGFTAGTALPVTLPIAKGVAEEFGKRADKAPVVATIVSGGGADTTLATAIKDGKLEITAGGTVTNLKVAFMVDTRAQPTA